MNILIVSQVFPYPPHASGAKLKLYYLMKGLSENRHNVYMASFYESEEEAGHAGEVGKYCKEIYTFKVGVRKRANIFYGTLGVFRRYPAESDNYFDYDAARKISEIILKKKIDIVHCELIYMARYVPYIPNGIPKIISINDVNWILWRDIYRAEVNLYAKARSFVHYLRTRNFEIDNYKRFDRCIVVSRRDKEELEPHIHGRAIQVIPNGVDLNLFSPAADIPDAPELIFTGVMSYRPNIDAMQYFCKEIFPIIKDKVNGAVLNIVGRDPSPEVVRLQSDDVKVTGFVEDITSYARKSSVYVCPLRMGSGIKNKVLEAMAMGLPIVASGSSVEAIDGIAGKDYITADDAKSFANAVISLLGDKNRRKELGMHARMTAEDLYGWKTIVQKYEEMYKVTVGHKTVGGGI